MLIESMMHQFAGLGLESIVVPAHSMTQDELQQWRTNWNFDPAVADRCDKCIGSAQKSNNFSAAPLLLVSPSGKVAASWQYPVSPADVWLQIQSYLGTPAGTQQMPALSERTHPIEQRDERLGTKRRVLNNLILRSSLEAR